MYESINHHGKHKQHVKRKWQAEKMWKNRNECSLVCLSEATVLWYISFPFYHCQARHVGDQIRAVLALTESEPLVEAFRSLGFTSVNLDLEGLVSGKLNRR